MYAERGRPKRHARLTVAFFAAAAGFAAACARIVDAGGTPTSTPDARAGDPEAGR